MKAKKKIKTAIKDLDKRLQYTVWHDGGEWFIGIKEREETNCKTLKGWLAGKE